MSEPKTPATKKVERTEEVFRKRTRFFVDRKFQGRFLALWLMTAFWLVFALGFLYLAGTWLYLRHQANPATWSDAEYRRAVQFFVAANVVFVVLLVALVGVLSVLHSHRIAGAAYRIKADLARIRGGDSTLHIHLRKTDFLQDVADEVNETVAHFRHRIRDQERRLEIAKDFADAVGERELPQDLVGLADEVARQLAVKRELPLDPITVEDEEERR